MICCLSCHWKAEKTKERTRIEVLAVEITIICIKTSYFANDYYVNAQKGGFAMQKIIKILVIRWYYKTISG